MTDLGFQYSILVSSPLDAHLVSFWMVWRLTDVFSFSFSQTVCMGVSNTQTLYLCGRNQLQGLPPNRCLQTRYTLALAGRYVVEACSRVYRPTEVFNILDFCHSSSEFGKWHGFSVRRSNTNCSRVQTIPLDRMWYPAPCGVSRPVHTLTWRWRQWRYRIQRSPGKTSPSNGLWKISVTMRSHLAVKLSSFLSFWNGVCWSVETWYLFL